MIAIVLVVSFVLCNMESTALKSHMGFDIIKLIKLAKVHETQSELQFHTNTEERKKTTGKHILLNPLWFPSSVISHISDSELTSKNELGKTKLSYKLNFGRSRWIHIYFILMMQVKFLRAVIFILISWVPYRKREITNI